MSERVGPTLGPFSFSGYTIGVTDFVGLCRAARELPGADTHDRLWAAWCALPEWHFLSAPSPVGPLPFSNFVHGQRCVMAFTSIDAANSYAAQMRVGPLMTLTPDATMRRLQQLRSYGVYGFLVDVGPNGFHTSLDNLWGMFHRFREQRYIPQAAPPVVAAPVAPTGPIPGSLEWFRTLPTWHVVMSKKNPSTPELASEGSDLIAQVYSSPLAVACAGVGPTVMMPPAQVISMLVDMELVKLVRFDGRLVVDVIDVATTR